MKVALALALSKHFSKPKCNEPNSLTAINLILAHTYYQLTLSAARLSPIQQHPGILESSGISV